MVGLIVTVTVIVLEGLYKRKELNFDNLIKLTNHHTSGENMTMEIMLTNKCNLNCSYCIEQHDTDENWSVEKLKTVYDTGLKIAKENNKKVIFQFFGGEPLLHKELITKFLSTYHKELEINQNIMQLSMITNGLLLDKDFLELWYSNPTRMMNISLDTLDIENDHREITTFQLKKLLRTIDNFIPQIAKDNKLIGIRCTISRETYQGLGEFLDKMYNIGIKVIIVHPLIFSAEDTENTIVWQDDEWMNLYNTVTNKLLSTPDFDIKFIEGVSDKDADSNCFTDRNLFAIDSDGNFGGCYLIPNNKDTLGDYVMGNFLTGEVHLDKYDTYNDQYKEARNTYEECLTCDFSNQCYTCPAMSLVLTGDAFAPSPMCKKMAEFSVLVNDLNKTSNFITHMGNFLALTNEEQVKRLYSAYYELIHSTRPNESDINFTLDSLLKEYELHIGKSIFEHIGIQNDNYSTEQQAFFVHYFHNTKG